MQRMARLPASFTRPPRSRHTACTARCKAPAASNTLLHILTAARYLNPDSHCSLKTLCFHGKVVHGLQHLLKPMFDTAGLA